MRIVQKEVRGRIRYFADLVISGYPPSKNRKLGKGDVGLDIGTSSLAVSSLTKAALFNLAEQVQEISRDIRLIQRKMDRSKRATNPQNFNRDGTIKQGKKTWVFSNHYRKYRVRLKELHRKQAVIRKLSHRTLANELLTLGDHFCTETMHFKALQKRKQNTETSGKTGKYIRKKRFGKTLGHRAPAMFITILREKVIRLGGTFAEVNTQKFKASQYCHVKNIYSKKPLSQRWHVIDDNTKLQRDLYSAFLLMNANRSGTKPNRSQCEAAFPLFKKLHDQVIRAIVNSKRMILNSGIIVKN
ncbi:hypothetical protein [Lentibacillus sp. CBA3610]|uniref:hypothetical protein n=1 Tax=Lentibacillus sp. CBA3610 TaxID=2518176 RepID=UPI001594EF27|nr:hypothetical protein [Lentibacillus sp. CBA3610]QKY68458.1 hypothetical protein Len3610_01435 [Lentibacillus sp. CBA3610]